MNRYKFRPREMHYLFLLVVLTAVGSCSGTILHYPVFEYALPDIIVYQTTFELAISVGLFFRYRYWNFHKKSIPDEISKLLPEIQQNQK